MKKGSRFTLITGIAIIALSLILSACGSAEPVTVEVTLTEFGIESSLSTFEPGQTYRFVITNEGALPHEFVITEPLMEGAEHDDSMEDAEAEAHDDEKEMSHEGVLLEVGEDELPVGATVTVEVTFPDEAPEEALEFACHISGHYEGGMHAPITIQ